MKLKNVSRNMYVPKELPPKKLQRKQKLIQIIRTTDTNTMATQ